MVAILDQESIPVHRSWKDLFYVVAIFLGPAAIGFGLVCAFWGIWNLCAGSIPKIWGISRLWLDSIPGAIYTIIIILYLSEVEDSHDELSEDGEYAVSFKYFTSKFPFLVAIGGILVASFLIGICFSLAIGLVAFGILAIAALIIYGICYGVRIGLAYVCLFIDNVFAAEEP